MINYRKDDYPGNSSARLNNTEADTIVSGQIYPNPGSTEVYYDIMLGENQSGKIELINSLGQIIATYDLISGANHLIIDVSDLSSGSYAYRVHVEGEAKFSEVLMISK